MTDFNFNRHQCEGNTDCPECSAEHELARLYVQAVTNCPVVLGYDNPKEVEPKQILSYEHMDWSETLF